MPIRGKPANSLTLSTLANVRNPLIDDLPDDASDLGDDCKPKIKKNNTVNNKRNSNEYRIHHRLSDHNEVSHEQELLELYEEQELEHNQKRRSESELQEQESEEEEECKRLRQCHEENARSMSFLENSGLECSFGRDFMHSESVSNDNYCLNRNSYNTNGNYSILNSSVDRKANKIAIDAVLAATQHFVHIMQMHELNSFFAVRDGASREENVKKQLSTKSTNEMHSIIMAFVEILEDLRIERGKLALLTGIPALEDNMPEERMMSASLFSTMSTASLSRPPVHETHEVAMSRDKQGNMMINRYIILANLGQGAYGKVKLGEDIDTGKQVAIKIISKKHLKKKIGSSNAGEASDALNREIAIMKKVRHKNCVSLYEVIDDPVSQRLYLIMDYIPNGPVVRVQHQRVLPIFLAEVEAERVVDGIKYNRELVRCLVHHDASAGKVALSSSQMEQRPSLFMCKPLKQRLCANYLRQLVSGLRYMHKRNVVHHDIKPDNILLGYDHHVYLTDFGVSEIMETESNDEDNNNNNGYSVGNKSITTSTQDALSKNANDALSDNMRESQKHNGPTTNTTTVNTTSVGKCTTKTTSQRCDRGARLGGGTLLFTAPEFFSSSFANASSTSERVNNPSTNNKVENEKEQHKQEKQNINTSKEEHKEEKENNNDNDKIVGSNLIDPFATDVWALGVTLYCMLVGCAPFNGNVYPEVVRSITTQDIP